MKRITATIDPIYPENKHDIVSTLHEALYKSKKYFSNILNRLHDGVLFYDTSLQLVNYNEGAAVLLQQMGRNAAKKSQSLLELFPDNDKTEVPGLIKEVLKGDIIEHDFLYDAIAEKYISFTFYPIDDNSGNPSGICIGLKDITARKKAEMFLQYKVALLDNVNDGIIATDMNFKIISFNKAAEKIYGIPAAEAIGKIKTEIIRYRFESGSREEAIKYLRENNSYSGRAIYERRDGKLVYLEASLSFVFDDKGNRNGMVAVIRDITEKKLLQQKVNVLDSYTQTVINSTREAIFILRLNGDIRIYNEYARRLMLKFTGSDIKIVKNLIDALPDARKKEVTNHLAEVAKGRLREYDVKYPGNKWLQVCFFPVTGDNKMIGEICCTLRDITVKKKTEQRIIESGEMYRGLFESMAEGMIYQSADREVITANDSAAFILKTRKEIIQSNGLLLPGVKWLNVLGEPVDIESNFCDLVKNGIAVRNSTFGLQREENITWLSINAEPLRKGENKNEVQGCVFTFTDITETIKNREELNLFSRMVKETSNIVVITNRSGKILWANDSFTKTSEYTLEEATGKKPGFMLRGSEKDKAEIRKMREAIKNGNHAEGEVLNYSKTGKKYWVNYNIQPVTDEQGRLIKFFSIQSDITELKKVQEEMVKQRLEQQSLIAHATIKGQEEKQTEIGQELHDNVNQLLAASKMTLGLTLTNRKDNKELTLMVMDTIQEAIDEIRNLSHRLVAPRFQETSLAEGIEMLAENMKCNTPVKICVNELKDMELQQDIKLTLFRIAQEQLNNIHKYARASEVNLMLKNDDKNVVMTIHDDGVGFDTSKVRTGIGISNIHNRAESFFGKAEIISAPGRGCKLEVIIPLQKAG